VLISQPSDSVPLQSRQAPLQDSTHNPPLQVGVALFVLHAFAQLPQWFGLVSRLASQPSDTTPLQSRQLPWQVSAHFPLLHVGVAWFVLHAVEQLPQ
jgi:hypothetical protein